jgi:hypothetical protein
VLGQDDVHTAAGGQGERALRAVAGHLRAGVGAADQELREGHEVIEAPQVEPRTEEPSGPIALHAVAADIPGETVAVEFRGQAQVARGVVGKRAATALVTEGSKRRSGIEIHVTVTTSELKAGQQSSGRLAGSIGCGGKRGRARGRECQRVC